MKPSTLREMERRKLERLHFMIRLRRDRAIAAYYKIKCKLLKLHIKKLELMNEKLRLEKEEIKIQKAHIQNKKEHAGESTSQQPSNEDHSPNID